MTGRRLGLSALALVLVAAGSRGVMLRAVRAAPMSAAVVPQTEAQVAGVQIDQAHVFIVPSDDRLQVAEYYLVGNSGQSDFEGTVEEGQEVPTTIAFELPAGATNLVFDGPGFGERYLGDARRFADTLAIPPGTATVEVGFSYELPMPDEAVAAYRIELARSLDVSVASAVLIVSGQGTGLSGEGLTFTGDIDTRMGAAASYIAGPLEAGEPLVVQLIVREITGLPTAPAVGGAAAMMRPQERNAGGEIVAGVAALTIAGLAAYWAWSSRPLPAMPESARSLVEAMVALDARHEKGEMDHGEYQRRRQALERDIERVIRQGG